MKIPSPIREEAQKKSILQREHIHFTEEFTEQWISKLDYPWKWRCKEVYQIESTTKPPNLNWDDIIIPQSTET